VHQIDVLAIHPLFSEDAVQYIERQGFQRIWSSDSILHPSNVVCLASLLAGGVNTLVIEN